MNLPTFTLKYMLTTLHFGINALERAKEFLKSFEKAVIVMGKTSARISGAFTDVEKMLIELGLKYVIYDKVTPNPWASQVDELTQIAWNEGVDLIIAIGGGSPIDVSKIASVTILSGGKVKDYIGGRRYKRSLPLLVVNLTHGTGTEIDRYAVVTLDDSREKHGLSIKYPEVSIDDPRYTLTLDKRQTIYTSLDAFYHSYEAVTSKISNIFIETMAEKAISIIASDLPKLVNNLRNLELRYRMLYASMLSGIAIDAGSTHIIHAIEHAISGLEPRIAHACGLALLGPRATYYIHKANPIASAAMLKLIDSEIKPFTEYAEKASKALHRFQEEIGFSEKLSDYGFTSKDIDKVVEYTMKRLGYMITNTPFQVDENIIKDIVVSSL